MTPAQSIKRDRMPGVYVLRFKSGCVYVGASMHIGRRVESHTKNLRRGSHPLAYLQAHFDQWGEPEVTLRPVAVEDAYELQVVERVTIRTMRGKLGRAKVLNRSDRPAVVVVRDGPSADDVANGGPVEFHPFDG
jgi:hypothetical protein